MMNIMYTNGFGSILPLFWALHGLGMLLLFFGIAFLLLWAFKHLSVRTLWTWGWILTVLGVVLCLPTLMLAPAYRMMGTGNSPLPVVTSESVKTVSQQKEEAEGKALYDKLQAKQATCTDLSDADFELIGEYVMGQRAGSNHEQMNSMIKQMMGGDDAPMHIMLGRNATGCTSGSQGSQPFGGMMNGGGMMRGFTSSSSAQ